MKSTYEQVPESLRKYVGQHFPLEDQHARAEHQAFTHSNHCLGAPHTPFGRISRNGILLNEETRAFIYDGDFGKIPEPYRKGSRPLLESWVAQHTDSSMSEGEKAVALSQSLYYDLPKRHPKVPIFLYGEDDEDTLLKGGGHCSCKGRLLAALCQVAGLHARPLMMWTWRRPEEPEKQLGGHTVAEIFIDGSWGFFDPQHHCYAITADGRFPSVWEIRQNPEIFTKTPDDLFKAQEVVGYTNMPEGMSDFEYYWWKNFAPGCPIQIAQHDVNDPGTPDWLWATPEFREKQVADFAATLGLLTELADKGELTDKVYQMGPAEFREAFNLKTSLPVLV